MSIIIEDDAQVIASNADKLIKGTKYAEGIEQYKILRERFPKNPKGYISGMASSAQINDFDAVEEIYKNGLVNIPGSFDLQNSYIDYVLRRRNYDKALMLAKELVENFTTNEYAYRRLVDVYIIIADYVHAEEVCKNGLIKCDKPLAVLAGYARLASAQRDFETSLSRWTLYSQQCPLSIWGYLSRVDCLWELRRFKESEELCKIAMEKMPKSFDAWRHYAELAMRECDFEEALIRWQVVRDKFPKHPAGYTRAVSALLAICQWDKAEELCAEGISNAPDFIDCWFQYADLALRRHEYDETVKRSMEVIKRFPYSHCGYTKAAYACMGCLNFDLAEKLADAAIKQSPNEIASWLCRADLAARREDSKEARRRRKAIMENFPRNYQGYVVYARALIEIGEYEDAEKVCLRGIELMPYVADIYICYAEVSMRKLDYYEARIRWDIVRKRFPTHPSGYIRGASACINDSLPGEAQKICDVANIVMPYSYEIHALKADMALYRYYDRGSILILKELCDRFPYNPSAWLKLSSAYIRFHEYEFADECIKKAINLSPFNSNGYIAQAELAYRKKEANVALMLYNSISSRFPYELHSYIRQISLTLFLQNMEEAESIYESTSRIFNKAISNQVLLSLCIAKIDIYLHKNRPDLALELAKKLYLSDPYYKHHKSLISKINDCFIPLHSMIAYNNIDIVNCEYAHFLIYALLSSSIAMREGMFILGIERWQYRFKKQDIKKMISNAIDKYNISNIYTPILTDTSNEASIFNSIHVLLKQAYNFTFKLCNFADKNTILYNIIDDIIFNKEYLQYKGSAIYNLIEIVNFFNPVKACYVNRDVVINNHNSNLSDPYGILTYRINNKRDLDIISASNVLKKTKKLSIAICISGQLRGYNKCLKPLFNTFDFENHNYTIFVHAWKDIGRKYPLYSHAYRVFKGNFYSAYIDIIDGKDTNMFLRTNYPNFDKLLIKSSDVNKNDLKDFYKTQHVELEDDREIKFKYYANYEKMYYKIQKCNDMTKSSQYDLIIRTRPDNLIHSKSKFSLYDIFVESNCYGCIFVPGGYSAIPAVGSSYQITDAFAIGAQHYMNAYSETYNIFTDFALKNLNYRCCRVLWPHSALSWNLFTKGINVRKLDFSSSFIDPEILSIYEIYESLKKDIATRMPTKDDLLLLQACEADIAEEKATNHKV